MRPSSVRKFETFYLLSWLLMAFVNIVTWRDAAAGFLATEAGRQIGVELLATITVANLLISLALWYLAARRASKVALWILVALFVGHAFSIGNALINATLPQNMTGSFSLIAFGLRAAAFWFVSRADALAWFRGVEESNASPQASSADDNQVSS